MKTEKTQGNAGEYEAESPIPPNPMERNTSGYDENGSYPTEVVQKTQEPYWQKLFRRWSIVISTIGLFFFTALLFFQTSQQAQNASLAADSAYALTRRVAETQERFAKVEMRPYIVFGDSFSYKLPSGKTDAVVKILYKNVGKTPAYNVAAYVTYRISARISLETFDAFPKPDTGNPNMMNARVLGFGESSSMTWEFEWQHPAKSDSARGNPIWYFQVSYLDIFKEWHQTRAVGIAVPGKAGRIIQGTAD